MSSLSEVDAVRFARIVFCVAGPETCPTPKPFLALQPPDIRLFPGHQISVVCPPGEYPSFNIMLEFANFGARLGVLQFVERVRRPDKVSPLFEWFSPGPPKYRHGVTAPLLLLLPAV